jgi:hypothetical protein
MIYETVNQNIDSTKLIYFDDNLGKNPQNIIIRIILFKFEFNK